MKQVLTALFLVAFGIAGSAQKIIKEKIVTKVDGPVVEKKSKIEYERSSSGNSATIVGSSTTSHPAYARTRHYGHTSAHGYATGSHRRHSAARMTSVSHHAAYRRHVAHRHAVHYKKY